MKFSRSVLPALALLAIIATPFAVAESGQTGLSAYTSRVLDRAEKGLAEILKTTASNTQSQDFSWLPYTTTKAGETLDPKVIRTLQQEMYSHATACLTTDATLILEEMAKVATLLQEANERHDGVTSQRLNDLYTFLSDRLGILTWGGTNPGYQDPTWKIPHVFDSTEERTALENEVLCPFNSRYLDIANDASSGCLPDVLSEAIGLLPDGTDELKNAFAAERDATQALIDAWKQLHTTSSEMQWEGCEEMPPAYTWSSGFFWEYPGQEFDAFMHLEWNRELQRLSPTEVENSSSSGGFSRTTVAIGLQVIKAEQARQTRTFGQAQTKDDAIIGAGILHMQEISDAFEPLTKTIRELGHLAHDKDSEPPTLRDMVQNFAYFLRRSCMNRPCNDRLDNILNIVGNDACFPYTSGSGDVPEHATQQDIDTLVQTLESQCEVGSNGGEGAGSMSSYASGTPSENEETESIPAGRRNLEIPLQRLIKYFQSGPRVHHKPALYLYPEKPTRVRVTLETHGGTITESIPHYGSGWDVSVTPNGQIDDMYGYLYYEAKAAKDLPPPDEGWIVPTSDVREWFDAHLPMLGLNKREAMQFEAYWIRVLSRSLSPYWKIRLIAPDILKTAVDLQIDPKPDTEIRLMFLFQPLAQKESLPEPTIVTPRRSGFTAVEWGGILDGELR